MYDSLLVLATAAKNLEYHMDSILFRNQDGNVSCGKEIPWMEGTTFFNYLNAVTVTGITGNISLLILMGHIMLQFFNCDFYALKSKDGITC